MIKALAEKKFSARALKHGAIMMLYQAEMLQPEQTRWTISGVHPGGIPSPQTVYHQKKLQKSPGIRRDRDYPWQGQKESNPRHAVLETAALPAELYPYKQDPGAAANAMVGLHGLEPWTVRL